MLYNGGGGGFAFGSTQSNTSGINSTGPGSVFASQGGFSGQPWHPAVGGSASGWGNGGGAPAGGAGGGGGGAGADINALLARQQQQNDQAKASNEANWQQGKGLLLGAQQGYFNDPMHQQAQGLVGGLMANPEAINDRTQAAIQNNAASGINARTAAGLRTQQGMLAANGQMDASSMAAIQERAQRQGNAQISQTQSSLDVQRALQRNQDIMNAANMGNQMAGQNYGVNAGTAGTFLSEMPQYKADDLSGYIAGFKNFQNGGGGGAAAGGGAPAGGGGSGLTSLFTGFTKPHGGAAPNGGSSMSGGGGMYTNPQDSFGFQQQPFTPGYERR